jgi:hypothetical protein
MRTTSTALAVLLFGCAGAAAPSAAEARRRPPRPRAVVWDERPLETLLAEASRSGTRVVVDFWARW